MRFLLALCVLVSSALAQSTRYTPTEFKMTMFNVALSTDGTDWVDVLESDSGTVVDIADAAAFSRALGASRAIPAGVYKHIRMTLSRTLTWSHPGAPVNLSNQQVVVNGPPGPISSQMTVYFATYDQGGRPKHDGADEGTKTHPLLLGAGAEILAETDTALRLVFVISNTLKDQGSGNYDLGPPQMFFVADNGKASTLNGTFNTVLFLTNKEEDGGSFTTWKHTSGHGALAFDGNGSWAWTGTTNEYDVKTRSGAVHNAKQKTGRYGVNANGSFWMTVDEEAGTLRGAISSDGTIVLATMFNSPTTHMMLCGVNGATAATAASLLGDYYFTTYGSRCSSSHNQLRYLGTFGVVTGDGTGAINGTQDRNEVRVDDPTGTPSFTAPSTQLNDPITDTITVHANGSMTANSGSMGGAMLESGLAGCISFDYGASYEENNEFGFLVRQSTAGTFDNASLTGTYYGGHFGDVYRTTGGGTTHVFSGFFKITFDGAGSAVVTLLENKEGTLRTETQPTDYTVDTATGIVTFSEPGGGEAKLEGAIGPNAMSFILSARRTVSGQPNEERFLGLGLRQD